MNPGITVVIPVRNRAAIVGRTLASVEAQTMAPARVVLVDNGSTDGTRRVLESWAKGKPNVTVLDEPRPGAAIARNRGLAAVETDYVMFFDSDDLMPSTHIADICAGIDANGFPPLVVFDMALHTLDGHTLPRPYRHKGDPVFNQLFHGCLATLRWVVKAETLRAAGGWNEAMRGWDDLELGIRLTLADRPVWIPLTTPVVACSQAESITGTSFSGKRGEWEAALDAIEATLRANRPDLAPMVDYRRAILAGNYRREGDRHAAREVSARISHKPLLMKAISRYVAAGGRGVAIIARLLR